LEMAGKKMLEYSKLKKEKVGRAVEVKAIT
jgi:hypothetical protein